MGPSFLAAITFALFADLANVKTLKHRWHWVVGDCRGIGEHQWAVAADVNEFAVDQIGPGWSIDGSHGARRPLVVMRHDAFVFMRGGTNLRIMASI
jgi:hypothetical protein